MPRPLPVTLSKWLLLAYASAFAAIFVWAGAPDSYVGAWVFVIVSYFWVIGPVAVLAILTRISRTEVWTWIILGLQGAMILFTFYTWYSLFFTYPDPQNPIGLLIFLPLWEYAAVFLFLVLGFLLGWRAKQSFLNS